MRYAIIDGAGRVVSVILATADWPVPAGCTMRPATATDVAWQAPAERLISATDFLARFTAAETAALWAADARLMAGALKVASQGSANLDSPEAAQLMGLAVARGVLTSARAAQILA